VTKRSYRHGVVGKDDAAIDDERAGPRTPPLRVVVATRERRQRLACNPGQDQRRPALRHEFNGGGGQRDSSGNGRPCGPPRVLLCVSSFHGALHL
jgi:hypothetical protein